MRGLFALVGAVDSVVVGVPVPVAHTCVEK